MKKLIQTKSFTISVDKEGDVFFKSNITDDPYLLYCSYCGDFIEQYKVKEHFMTCKRKNIFIEKDRTYIEWWAGFKIREDDLDELKLEGDDFFVYFIVKDGKYKGIFGETKKTFNQHDLYSFITYKEALDLLE